MNDFLHRFARKSGVEIKKYMPGSSYKASLQKLLAHNRIDLVLDVGANVGQYARTLRIGGFRGRIVSFEPLSSAYEKLRKAKGHDRLWEIAPRMAIGDTDGEIEINISANSVSSSIAPMLAIAANAEANATYVGKEKARIAMLDTIAKEYVAQTDVVFLKIDAQGYELPVLQGAGDLLQSIRGLQLELAVSPLYEGEVFYLDMIKKIYDLGFELHGMFPAFTDVKTGRMLQADGIFFRP